jgi:hypothetical protein
MFKAFPWFVVIATVFFALGIASGSWHSFPYELVRSTYHYIRPASPPSPPSPPAPRPQTKLLANPRTWDEETLLKARVELRNWLVPTINVKSEPMKGSTDFLATLGQEERAAAERVLSGVRVSIISGEFAEIRGWRWRSLYLQNNGRKLVVVHQGHAGNPFEGHMIERSLEAGYDVIAMTMPMKDWNAMGRVEVNTWDGKGILISPTLHGAFEMIDTGDHHFIGFFVAPVIASIDVALSAEHYESVAMMGLSGGGWTTTVTAAADERIGNAISVAGTLPFFARQQTKDLSDAEQYDGRFYSRFGWPMLYEIAVAPNGRNLTLLFNLDDPCCFDEASAGLLAEFAKESAYRIKIIKMTGTYSIQSQFLNRLPLL